MLIHSFTSASKRDAAADNLDAAQWPKKLKVNLAADEDLRIKDVAADGTPTIRDAITFPASNRFLIIAART
ncbi:MAG: hypothetical protein ACOYM5_10245 [Caulobacter sp.]